MPLSARVGSEDASAGKGKEMAEKVMGLEYEAM